MAFNLQVALNIGSVLMNAKQMNRSMCLDISGFLYRLPGEEFLNNFITTQATRKQFIDRSVIQVKHKNTEKDLTVHVEAAFDYKLENFTWASGEPVQQKYWAKRFNYIYPRLTTRVIHDYLGLSVAEIGNRYFYKIEAFVEPVKCVLRNYLILQRVNLHFVFRTHHTHRIKDL